MRNSCIIIVLMILMVLSIEAKTISFSGYEWIVKSGYGGPGDNYWAEDNAWVDNDGNLHLKITKEGDKWYCSEVHTKERFGFGRYQFYVIGRIDKLDKNVVFGIFNYTRPDIGPDGTNEIDIEITRWGHAIFPNGYYTVWPGKKGYESETKKFYFLLTGTHTTHRFEWQKNKITFRSLHGHRDDNKNTIKVWTYEPENFSNLIPQSALPIHINLWLFKGREPSDKKEVEVIITDFKYETD